MKRFLDILYFMLLFAFVIAKPVYAYLDPGTGSMILQVIAAAIVAVGVYIKVFWNKIAKIFGKKTEE